MNVKLTWCSYLANIFIFSITFFSCWITISRESVGTSCLSTRGSYFSPFKRSLDANFYICLLSFLLSFWQWCAVQKNVDFHIQAENGVDRLFNLTASVRILLGLVSLFSLPIIGQNTERWFYRSQNLTNSLPFNKIHRTPCNLREVTHVSGINSNTYIVHNFSCNRRSCRLDSSYIVDFEPKKNNTGYNLRILLECKRRSELVTYNSQKLPRPFKDPKVVPSHFLRLFSRSPLALHYSIQSFLDHTIT